MCSKGSQDAPRERQGGPKGDLRGATWPPRWAKRAQRGVQNTNKLRKMIPRCEKRHVDFSSVFKMKMRSWRVWLGSFWAHVEIMWCHCGHLGRTWGTWRAILEDLEQQEAKRWHQEAKSESKNERWWSKQGRRGAPRGTEGHQGATRVWVGGVWASNRGVWGEVLGSSWSSWQEFSTP